jgi:hypothetical protein
MYSGKIAVPPGGGGIVRGYRKLCINGVCYVKLEITNINYHHYSFLLIAPNTPKQKASDTII